jgi:LPXTG-motif cell wall-anchored protein
MKTSAPVTSTNGSTVLKKEEMSVLDDNQKNSFNGVIVGSVALALFVALLVVLRRKRKKK